MAIERPTIEQLQALASRLNIRLTPAQAEEYLALMQANFDAYDLIDALPDDAFYIMKLYNTPGLSQIYFRRTPSPPKLKKSSYESTGFFIEYCTHRGDEKPRPGFDNWRQPVGQTVNAVSGLPAGRATRVNPPLTAIFELRARSKVRAFFFYIRRWGV